MGSSNPGAKAARRQRRIARRMAALGVPDFETPADCTARQDRMVGRLRRRGASRETVEGLADCSPQACGMFECRDGCHFAARRFRHEMVPRAAEIFEQHEGPLWFVTVVHPDWSWPTTEPFSPERIRQAHDWLATRLERLGKRNLLAIGSWELCLNVELDGTCTWSGHIHFIIAGVTYDALEQALAISKAEATALGSKPLMIKPVVSRLARTIAYCNKLYAEQRSAYQDKTTRQNRNHLPLRVPEQYYFDHALCSINLGTRMFWFDAWPYVPDVISVQAL